MKKYIIYGLMLLSIGQSIELNASLFEFKDIKELLRPALSFVTSTPVITGVAGMFFTCWAITHRQLMQQRAETMQLKEAIHQIIDMLNITSSDSGMNELTVDENKKVMYMRVLKDPKNLDKYVLRNSTLSKEAIAMKSNVDSLKEKLQESTSKVRLLENHVYSVLRLIKLDDTRIDSTLKAWYDYKYDTLGLNDMLCLALCSSDQKKILLAAATWTENAATVKEALNRLGSRSN